MAVVLNAGVPSFPTRLAEGLVGACQDHLADIEISPAGLGPGFRLDADLYVPALLPRVFGSKSWMARVLGAQGGRARTVARGCGIAREWPQRWTAEEGWGGVTSGTLGGLWYAPLERNG